MRGVQREGHHVSGLAHPRDETEAGRAPVRLAARLELPAAVRHEELVSVTLIVTNICDEPVEVAAPGSSAVLNLVVLDALWDQVAAEPFSKIHTAPRPVLLAPGESEAFALEDLSYVTGTARMAFRLQPGTYRVAALYHPGSGRLPEEHAAAVAVASNVETVTVEALEGGPRGAG